MVQIHSPVLILATYLASTGLQKSWKFNIGSVSHCKPATPSVTRESVNHSLLQLPIVLYSVMPLPLRPLLLFLTIYCLLYSWLFVLLLLKSWGSLPGMCALSNAVPYQKTFLVKENFIISNFYLLHRSSSITAWWTSPREGQTGSSNPRCNHLSHNLASQLLFNL